MSLAKRPSTAAIAGLISLLAFAALAYLIEAGAALRFDLPVREAIHSKASPFLTRLMIAVSFIGRPAFMPFFGALAVWRLAATKRVADAVWFACTAASAELLLQVVQNAFRRPRPDPFFNLPRPDTFSFPSGHALMCTVFYVMLATLTTKRPAVRTAAFAFVAVVGFSRVYLGFHYPTDVLGGFAAGGFWLSAGALLQSTKPCHAGRPHQQDENSVTQEKC